MINELEQQERPPQVVKEELINLLQEFSDHLFSGNYDGDWDEDDIQDIKNATGILQDEIE